MFAQYDPYQGSQQQQMDCSPSMLEQKQNTSSTNGFQHNLTSPVQNYQLFANNVQQQQQQQPYFGSYNNNSNQQSNNNNLFAPDFHRGPSSIAPQPQHAVVSPQHHVMRQPTLSLPMDAVNNASFPKPTNYSSSAGEPGSSFFDPHFNFTAHHRSSVDVAQAPQHSSQMDASSHLTTLMSSSLNNNSTADGLSRALVKTESYESDSGVSMELSPPRFNFGPPRDSPNGTFLQNEIKTESFADLNADLSRELKGVKHNHTYYGNGTKTRVSKKPMPSLSRESRDEKRARELGVPFTLDEIILTPVEEYNDMLARSQLTPEQQALIKDIRRRGKNKVAAQNCRKRKVETISNMEDDVDMLRNKKTELSEERNRLEIRANQMKHKYEALYKQVFETLRNEHGEPYDPTKFRLELVEGTLFILPTERDEGGSQQQSMRAGTSGLGRGQGTATSSVSDIDFNRVKLEMIDQ